MHFYDTFVRVYTRRNMLIYLQLCTTSVRNNSIFLCSSRNDNQYSDFEIWKTFMLYCIVLMLAANALLCIYLMQFFRYMYVHIFCIIGETVLWKCIIKYKILYTLFNEYIFYAFIKHNKLIKIHILKRCILYEFIDYGCWFFRIIKNWPHNFKIN